MVCLKHQGEKRYKQPETMNMDVGTTHYPLGSTVGARIMCVQKKDIATWLYDGGMVMRRHGQWTAGLSVSSSSPTGLTPPLSLSRWMLMKMMKIWKNRIMARSKEESPLEGREVR